MLKNKRILIAVLLALILLLVPSIVKAEDVEVNVTSIEVTAPESGVYAAGQEITIRVNFDKAIKGTVPELKIYFGTGDLKKITGPSVTTPVNYVDYKYTIQADDNGILRVYGFGSDFDLKDESDNSVYLNKIYNLMGNKIYAENSITRANLSNIDFEWKQESENTHNYLSLKIKNVTFVEENTYYVHLSHNKNEQLSALSYSDKSIWDRTIVTGGKNIINNVEDFLAENGDLYIWICEVDNKNGVPRILVSAKKVERLQQLPLGYRLKAYFFSDKTSTFNYEPLGDETRKINVKIGYISDINLLKAIKNGEANYMQKLLEYAKANEGFYNTQIPVGKYESVVSNLNLLNKEYYFVYMSVEDKNGKYYPIEDVSLYQALVSDKVGVNLFDYLDDNFTWNLDEDQENNQTPAPQPTPELEKKPTNTDTEDKTKAPGVIPYTGGTVTVIVSLLVITLVGAYAYKRNKDLKGI